MSYAEERAVYYEEKSTGLRRDSAQEAAEQLHKTISVVQERTDSLRSRLTPLLVPEQTGNDVAGLTAVNNSSPFVGQLHDMRRGLDHVVAVLMEIERRLTL